MTAHATAQSPRVAIAAQRWLLRSSDRAVSLHVFFGRAIEQIGHT